MGYSETYLIIGFLFTVVFEFIFETLDNEELKYSGFGERIIFFFLWPLIVLLVIRKTLKKNNNF